MNVAGLKPYDDLPPPLPPPKIVEEKSRLPPVPLDTTDLMPSSLNPNELTTPVTPTSTGGSRSQPPSPQPEARSKKTNPLTELVETEKIYVDQLAGIIRRVASAWSRSNLPPSELDQMFRAVEAVYKANRSLLSKLKEIGTSPSSPKALGDLLMRWVDDLEPPYAMYCNKYTAGFDTWEPVANNPKLPTTLTLFSASNPPLPSSSQASPSEPPLWTLDGLFLLPHGRLKYYKKLYGRLLKSTAPGRSDHKLLVGAMEKLERLLATVEGRFNVRLQPFPPIETEDEVVVDIRDGPPQYSPPEPGIRDTLLSDGTNSRHASISSGGNQSQTTWATSVDRHSGPTPPVTVADIERRLSTAKTLDLFTMSPRETKLQIETPGLTYTREVRISLDVTIDFTPKSIGQPVRYPRGHIFLLTDLFLICEWILPSERAEHGGASDISLIFPPLAGKHLKVSEIPDSDTALSILILRKETLTINTPSPQVKSKLLAEFRDCIDTAAGLYQRAKNAQPPPPVPSLPSLPRSISSPFPPSPGPHRPESGGPGGPPTRGLSPSHSLTSDEKRFSPPSRTESVNSERRWSPSGPPESLAQRAFSPELQLQNGPRRVVQEQSPDHLNSQRTSSTAETVMDGSAHRSRPPSQNQGPGGIGSPFRPGQVIPPPGSFGPGQVIPPLFGPGQVISQQSFSPGQVLPRSMSIQRGPGPPPRNMMSPPPGYGGPPPPRNITSPPPGQMGPFPPRNIMSPPLPRNMMSPPPDVGPRTPPLPGGPGGPPSPSHVKPPPSGHMGPSPPGYPGLPPKGPGLPSHPGPNPPGPNGMGPPPPGTWLPGPPGSGQHPGGPPLPGQPPFQPGPPRGPPQMQGQPPMDPIRGPPGPNGSNFNIPPHPSRQPTMDLLRPQSNGSTGPVLGGLRKTQSSHSLNLQFDPRGALPPVPRMPGANIPRNHSADSLPLPQSRPLLPSAQRTVSMTPSSQSFYEISPPNSPVRESAPYTGPATSTVSAQMKCKVFLKQQHAQWKSLGSAKLKLYRESPTNVKQLVVEADNKDKSILISTIVLTDGVERVGKTGVAIELSDKGVRTGVVYMLQLRNEKSAQGLFDSLLAGSDRS